MSEYNIAPCILHVAWHRNTVAAGIHAVLQYPTGGCKRNIESRRPKKTREQLLTRISQSVPAERLFTGLDNGKHAAEKERIRKGKEKENCIRISGKMGK